MPMGTIEASYRMTTPMFLAGADQKQAELRLPSFKGALRFWWRSLMWGKVRDWGELRAREASLFGAADQNAGQSKVRLRIMSQKLESVVNSGEVFEGGRLKGGAQYLGYGVMKVSAELTRAMIPAGSFTVACGLHPSLTDDERRQLIDALILLGTLGGLGSKSRKGYGSLTLTQMKVDQQSYSLTEAPPEARLTSILKDLADEQPEWTAWSRKSRLVIVTGGSRSMEVLDRLGIEQVLYRSWGRNGMVLGQKSEKNFTQDHDLSKGQNVPIRYPIRTAFGLPHNYGKNKEVGPASQNLDRRASPLFLHVHQVSNASQPIGLVAFLPSRFLPQGEGIEAFGRKVALDDGSEFWHPVHAFLDRLKSDGSKPQARPGYERFPADSQWWRKKTTLQGQEVLLV
jgi:CRISPR-associated protein Cmr1